MNIRSFVVPAVCMATTVQATQLGPGGNSVDLRGQKQEIHFIPAAGLRGAAHPAVLFLPGDRGWAGKAVDMARTMASWGFDVYGLDTNRYLSSFTGRTILTEQQIVEDLLTLSRRLAPDRRVLLAGWSEGAGLVALAASAGDRESKYAGVVVFGLSDKNVLAWRWKDNLSILTQSEPNEPTFSVKSRLASISPVPIAMLRATKDQYVTAEEAKELYEAAQEPKMYIEVPASNHRFDGNDEGFYRELKGAFEWAIRNSR